MDKKGERRKEKKMRERKMDRGREEERERFSRRSDCRISTVRELKLIHATRATRGY